MGLINKIFYSFGSQVAAHPFLVFLLCGSACLFMALGCLNLKLDTDPQGLWVSPSSRGNIEQTYVIDKYGAFFRINQFIMRPHSGHHHDLFNKPYLALVYEIQKRIEEKMVDYADQTFNLSDVCYKPITGKGCIVTSPMQYWLMNKTDMLIDPNIKATAQCIFPRYPDHKTCFDRIGTPVMKAAIFGDSNIDLNSDTCVPKPIEAGALLATFLLNKNPYTNPLAEEWEKHSFEHILDEFNEIAGKGDLTGDIEPHESDSMSEFEQAIRAIYQEFPDSVRVEVSYMAERSIPDDLVVQNKANLWVVILSYSLMFVYISCALGYPPSLLHSRFLVGFAGICVVLVSLVCSIGIVSYLGVKLSIISSEVVPFLILAIGVDNMFIITRAEKNAPVHITDVDKRLAMGLSNIGPSILCAATCEVLAFLVGTLTDIPALRGFCFLASLAVIIDFLLQITAFLAILSIDNKRIRSNRYDVCPCFRVSNPKPQRKEIIKTFFERHYARFALHWVTKICVVVVAIGFTIAGIFGCMNITLGISPMASVTTDSTIYNYLSDQEKYVDAGPPAYIVFRDINYTDPNNIKEIDILLDRLSALKKRVEKPIYSWIKGYEMFLMEDTDWAKPCDSIGINALPFDDQMRRFVNLKVESDCCLSYGICGEQFVKDIVFNDWGLVETTRFRFYHTPLRDQDTYIKDLEATRYVVDQTETKLTKNGWAEEKYKDKDENHSRNAFAYSLFYVFFEQYYYIRAVLAENLLIAIAAIILATQLITNIRAAATCGFCIFLIGFDLIGVSYLFNLMIPGFKIEFNAVFVVNIVMSMGLAVEFCVHVMIAFLRVKGTNHDRARISLSHMGSSVFVGIGTTKLIGITVLSFADSTIFRLYYFRMYMAIIVLGLAYGILLLPAILSYIGPPYAPEMGAELFDLKLKTGSIIRREEAEDEDLQGEVFDEHSHSNSHSDQ